MNYIYISYDGAFSAILGASIHAELIKDLNDNEQLIKTLKAGLKYKKDYRGNLLYFGCDSMGNKIYCLATKRVPLVIERALKGFEKILNNNTNDLEFVDMRKYDIAARPYLFFIPDKLMIKIYMVFIRKVIFKMASEINKVKNNGEV